MDKMIEAQNERNLIMANVAELIGDFETPEQEALFDKIDEHLCRCLGVDIKRFPTHIS